MKTKVGMQLQSDLQVITVAKVTKCRIDGRRMCVIDDRGVKYCRKKLVEVGRG